MTLAAFIGALEAAGVDLDAETVLDTLWLASLDRRLSLHHAPLPAPPQDLRIDAPATDPAPAPPPNAWAGDDNAPPAGTPTAPPPAPSPSPPPATAPGQTPVYPRGSPSAGDRTVKASPFAVPIGRALPGRLPLMRSLRPLNQRWPSARHLDLDEERTVEATAQLRVVLPGAISPVFRPGRERWYDAELVLEDDAAIELWADTLREFAQMLRETGAFRLVRSWRLRMPPRGQLRGRAWLENATGARVPSVHLAGSGVRRLVLFATHGSSSRWRDGSYAGVLTPWARDGSVLLLQLMPRERWAQTRLGEPQALVHTTRAGASAGQLKVEPLWWLLGPEQEDGGEALLPLPSVPLQAAALNEWARMQMSRGRHCLAYLLDPTPRTVAAEPAPPLASEQDFERAVAQLRRVSPQGFRLAVALCTSVFTIPVARLVQAARLGPGGDLAPLAEVLQSGLVSTRRDEAQPASLFTSTQYYEFRPEAKRILLRSLRNADAQQLAHDLREQVSHHIRQISGSQIKSTQLVPDENGRYDLPEWAQPFAQVASSLAGSNPVPLAADRHVETLRRLYPPEVVGTVVRLAAKGEPFSAMPSDAAVAEALRPLVHTDSVGQWRFDPEIAARLVELDQQQPLLGASAMWVDDAPQGNADAQAQLAAWGLALQLATSTEDALARLEREDVDLIISDMVRGHDEEAGLKLLTELRWRDNSIPFIVYAGRSVVRRYQTVMSAGALGCTSKLERLYEFVRQAVRDEPAAPSHEAEDHALERAHRVISARVSHPLLKMLMTAGLDEKPEEVADRLVELEDGLSIGLQVMHAYADAGDSQIAVLRGERLEVVADTANPAPRTQIIPSTGLVGECARQGRLIWAPNVAQVSAYLAANKETQSELVLPVFDQHQAKRVTAVVNLELPERDALSDAQIEWLASFAARLSRLLPVRKRRIFMQFERENADDAMWLARQLRIEAGVQIEAIDPEGRGPPLNVNDTLLVATSAPVFDFEEWHERSWQRAQPERAAWQQALPPRLDLIALMLKAPSRFSSLEAPANVRTVHFTKDRNRALRELIGLLGAATPAPVPEPKVQGAARIVNLFYVTDRERLADASDGSARYGSQAHNDLEAGQCTVRVPESHVVGALETPSLLRLQLTAQPEKHFVVRKTAALATRLLARRGQLSHVNRLGQRIDANSALLLYVHGFNLDFENAMLRAAQISFDLGISVMAYCWPSQGSVTAYIADQQAATRSAQHFASLLDELSDMRALLHIWADGLGAQLVVESAQHAHHAGRVQQLVFTRADVGADTLAAAAPALGRLARNVTHYVSTRDPVSAIAQQVNGHQRAATAVRPVPHMNVVDLSDVEGRLSRTELDTRLFADLRFVFTKGLPPDHRPGLRGLDSGSSRIWQMTVSAITPAPAKPSLFISYVHAYAAHANALAERLEEDLDLQWGRSLGNKNIQNNNLPQETMKFVDAVLAIAGPLTGDSLMASEQARHALGLGRRFFTVAVAPFDEPAVARRKAFTNVDDSGHVRYLESLSALELAEVLDRVAFNIVKALGLDPAPLALELRHTHRADPMLLADKPLLQTRGRRLEGNDFRSLVAQLQGDERLVGLHHLPMQPEMICQIASRRAFQESRLERGLQACYALDRSLLLGWANPAPSKR
jgi:esterase/lipase superfamily enzyme/FixJ family two-component response regulator